MEAEKNRSRGMNSEDARAAARREFGGEEQIKEIYRERMGLPAMETVLKDLQYALRGLRRSPGFTTIVILSLALGVGANTAIFSLIDAVMLRSLPVQAPEQLVSVGDAARPTAFIMGGPLANLFSYPLYRRLREGNQVFAGLLASGRTGHIDVGMEGRADEEAQARLVSANYFDVLAVSLGAGRPFSVEDEQRANAVVVISHDYWLNHFGGSLDVFGTTLRINGVAFTVIGIGPPGFWGEVVGSRTAIWIPLWMQPRINPGDNRLERRDSNWLLCMGRLKPGVSLQRARAEITAIVQNALIDYEGAAGSPENVREIRRERVDVEPGEKGFSWVRKHDAALLLTLMVLVALALLIACANIANLSLARGTSRQKEISMRLALGAGRSRLVRQLLTESALLATMAGTAGLLSARWGSAALAQLASKASGLNPVPFDVDVRPNVIIIAFCAGLSLLTVMLFGLFPALRATRLELAEALKAGGQNARRDHGRLGTMLVIGQLALSTVILMGSGLFIGSIARLNSMDVGYSRNHVIVMAADLAASGYPASERLAVTRRLVEVLRSIPGVAGATVSSNGIFSHLDSSTDSLQVEGFTPQRKDDSWTSFDQIGPHYFRVLGVPLIAGREFDEHDGASISNAAVINETMARFYFRNRNPLGQVLRNGGDRYTVIGVVKDMKEGGLKSKTERRFFGPLYQSSDPIDTLNFEIRTLVPAVPSVVAALRHRVQSLEPNLKIPSIAPVSILIDQDISGDRLIANLSEFFGVLVLLLAANGIYGVISYTTTRRTAEMGLRMAVGADRKDVMRLILKETAWLILAGLAVGLPIAFACARLISAMLAGVSPSDPKTIAAVSVILLGVGLLAGFVPAARAARVDPIVALRQE